MKLFLFALISNILLSQTNLIQNGRFEDGLNHWSSSGNVVDILHPGGLFEIHFRVFCENLCEICG